MYALTNCQVVDGFDTIEDATVIIDGERIAGVDEYGDVPDGVEEIDLDGLIVAPGFVDLQVNGGGGVMFNDSPTPETLGQIVQAHRRLGTTSLMPTVVSSSRETLEAALGAVEQYVESGGRGVLGVHVEGPFISPEKAGAHDPKMIRPMTDEDVEMLSAFTGGRLMLTLAPEVVGPKRIMELVEAGIKVSAGHTMATYNDMMDALDAGLDCATHLFNAMRPLESREPGVVGAVLGSEFCCFTVIADGNHVHWGTLKALDAAAGSDRMMLVSDAMSPAGTDMTEFEFGGNVIKVDEDLRCTRPDGGLAGSAIGVSDAVRGSVDGLDLLPEEGVWMGSGGPASYLGLEKELGRVKKGYYADLAVLDEMMFVEKVILRGEITELIGN